MANNSKAPPITQGNSVSDDHFDFAEAEVLVAQQQRKELVTKISELRHQADGAKERAKKAQARFERAVVLMASDQPSREDWYDHPGALPRKVLAQASGLSPVQLHRTMERYRKTAKR